MDDKVSGKTTHLVTLNARRTINMLRGIVRGVWILEYNWIVKSFEANEWLPELSYEMNSFSNAVEVTKCTFSMTFTYFVVKFLIFFIY